jgi:hypothetical protein
MASLTIDHAGGACRVETDLPEAATAGLPLAFHVTLRPLHGCRAGAQVALVRHWPADAAEPQGIDPAAPNHLSVTAGGQPLAWRRQRVEAWHPFDHAVVATCDRALPPGEAIVFATPGLGMQSFIEERSPLSLRLDAEGRGDWVEVARFHLRIEGGAPHRLVATAPSDVVLGEDCALHIRLEDVWGNPAQFPPMEVEAAGQRGTLRADQGAVLRMPLSLDRTGIHRLEVRAANGMVAQSNPILCHATPPSLRRHWGDLHAQSAIGCGARSIAAYFRHARDFAATDFGSHQANCFLVSNPEWEETQEVTQALHKDGRFVTLLGVEWSGAPDVGGDHNLYFPTDRAELRRCSHRHLSDLSDADTDLPHVTDLHRHYARQDVLMAVHVGGRTSNLAWHAPALERLVEVHSTHATSEWMVAEALQRGWRFGVTGGSDGVDGRLAASHPGRQAVRNLRGGLTAVALPALTRDALWTALKAGRTYGTNGPRILLEAAADGDGRFRVAVEGTAPIAAVTLLAGAREVARIVPPPRDPTPGDWWRLRWWGAKGRGNWSQTRLRWDGEAELHGATLAEARSWRWHTPAEGLSGWSARGCAWRSITAGSWDGVMLRIVDVAEDAVLHVRSPVLSAGLPLAGGAAEGAGDPPSRLVLERLPRVAAALGWAGRIADPAPDGTPHWLRVEQEDGGIAWSSPFWADAR